MEPTLCPRIYVERTLALIKPDGIHRAEEIEDDILKSGFTILQVGSDCINIIYFPSQFQSCASSQGLFIVYSKQP